mmetsp:Transcript_34667/g.80167  ORF Transcript_34667/g.80167 Transcript_34667/m.80167 type:complete len:214 (-) Transcript_34667:850-1491(-)
MKPDTCVSIVYAAIASITAKSAYGMEEINADVNASFLSKKMTGVRRSAAILSDMLFGSKAERAPKRFQLAVVGLGRTGSTSFHSALKELGYTPVHDDEAMEVADLLDAMTKDGASYGAIAAAFGRRGFDAAFLTTHRFVEWVASAPDVKVVLTVRDKKKWARSWLVRSCDRTIIHFENSCFFVPKLAIGTVPGPRRNGHNGKQGCELKMATTF